MQKKGYNAAKGNISIAGFYFLKNYFEQIYNCASVICQQ